VTASARAEPGVDHAALHSLALGRRQLGDLELIMSGAFAPLRGFMTEADVRAVAASGTLADGTAWPIPVTLECRSDAVPPDAGHVLLADPEGTPLAVLRITERTVLGAPDPAGGDPASGVPADRDPAITGPAGGTMIRLAGPVTAHRPAEHGPFRRLMISPEQARAKLGTGPVLAFATRAPLGWRQIGQLKHLAGQLSARLLLLPLTGGQAQVVRQPEDLVRAVLAAAASLPAGTLVVPVPLAPRPADGAAPPGRPEPVRELAAAAIVAAAHGATHLMADGWLPAGRDGRAAGAVITGLPGAPIPVVAAGEWAYDQRAEVWRPLSLIEPGAEIGDLSADQLADMLDSGACLPDWFAPEAVRAELRRARPPRSERGLVLFLTGLSGSGKSTLARDLHDILSERGERRVSLLDGDLVRSLLSAGLSFSRADRDLNIARIGYVAAEIARHGGIAICAPIAPYAAARQRVREMVCQAGDFLLIHVATPIEVCEARDRKGLYAKARAGLIERFTGISDPYEEPTDAVLTIDTSVLSREQAVNAVLGLLTSGGWLAGG